MRIAFLLWILIAITSGMACESNSKKTKSIPVDDSSQTQIPDSVYLKKGRQIVGVAFTELAGKLQAALQTGGVQEAVTYCNIAALSLTDSLSQVYKANIKRTSLQLRNTANAPTGEEMEVLQTYDVQAKAHQKLSPIIKRAEKQVHFYAPILTNVFCLKCHGEVGEDIKGEDYLVIKNKYPNDLAINYESGHFRGIWHVAMSP